MGNLECESWQKYRPGNDPYCGANLLEGLPYLLGDRGKFVVKLFAYLRYVDDMVDEKNGEGWGKEQKLRWLERQMGVITGFPPDAPNEMENLCLNLSWQNVPQKEVRHRIQVLLGSIVDDVEHQGLRTRSERELRHYNWRTMWPIVDSLFLVLNGKPIDESREFMEFLNSYMNIGHLEGLGDDLKQGVIKLSMEDGGSKITDWAEILQYYNKHKFENEKGKALSSVCKHAYAFGQLDIPWWQKIICWIYCGEVIVKKTITVSRTRAISPILGA